MNPTANLFSLPLRSNPLFGMPRVAYLLTFLRGLFHRLTAWLYGGLQSVLLFFHFNTMNIIIPETGFSVPTENRIIVKNRKIVYLPDHPYIGLIYGEGIGKEVIEAGAKVIAKTWNLLTGNEITFVVLPFGEPGNDLPQESLRLLKEVSVAFKGPIETPFGAGRKSVNAGIRQVCDLFACVRPGVVLKGLVSPNRNVDRLNITFYRENTQGAYAGLHVLGDVAKGLITLINATAKLLKLKQLPFSNDVALTAFSITREAAERIVTACLEDALLRPAGDRIVHIMHKANIFKSTHGMLYRVGFEVATSPRFRNLVVTEEEVQILTLMEANLEADDLEITKLWQGGYDLFPDEAKCQSVLEQVKNARLLLPTHTPEARREMILFGHVVSDNFFIELPNKPWKFRIVGSGNQDGDYGSDAVSGVIGSPGIQPGCNQGEEVLVYEALHGTAYDRAGRNQANPSAVILCGEMFFNDCGNAKPDLVKGGSAIRTAAEAQISTGKVTGDLVTLLPQEVTAEVVSTSQFTDNVLNALESLAA
jgi:isocitrate dehydrogenase